jgi:hypothetical protein
LSVNWKTKKPKIPSSSKAVQGTKHNIQIFESQVRRN